MKGKSLALLVLALGCGLVASLGITQVLPNAAAIRAPSDTTPVYVAKADIATGVARQRRERQTRTMAQGSSSCRGGEPPGRHRRPPRAAEDLRRRADHRAQTPRPRPGAHRRPGSQGAPRGCRLGRTRGNPQRAGASRIALRRAGFHSRGSRPWESAKPSARPSCRTSAYLPSTTSRAPSPRTPRPRT